MTVIVAALLYFALVFAAGFALGAVRTLVVVPRIGGMAAVLLELPMILAVSWVVARRLVARLRNPGSLADRLVMGLGALALLLVAEFALGTWGFGRSTADQLAAWTTAAGLLGLGGQLVFGLMPLLVRLRAA